MFQDWKQCYVHLFLELDFNDTVLHVIRKYQKMQLIDGRCISRGMKCLYLKWLIKRGRATNDD